MNTEMQDALKTLLAGMGLQLVQSFTSRFDSDAMVQEASERVGIELKAAFQAVLENTDSDATQKLLDDLFQAIELDDVIRAVAEPLAKSLADWFKEDSGDLIEAIVSMFDTDELMELVAQKIADRIQISETQ